MEKKRKKMPVKSRLRVWYQVSALVCALTVALAVPMVAQAENIEVNSPIQYGYGGLFLYDFNWTYIHHVEPYNVGVYLNVSKPSNGGFIWLSYFDLSYYLSSEQKYLITSSVDTSIYITCDIDISYDPSGFTRNTFYGQVLIDTNENQSRNVVFADLTEQPDGSTYVVNIGDFLYGADISRIALDMPSFLFGNDGKLVDMQYVLSKLNVVVKTVGADKSTADIVVNLEKIGDSINQGFDQMGDKLDGVQGSINQGFDQIGDQIGDVQEDINTGFDNVSDAINGAGSDTSGMDSGMAQLGGQLGDLGNVEDELGGLIMDKVEVPDLVLTNDQGSALSLLVSCLNLAYVDLKDYQVLFASVMFFGIIGVLLFGRRNL